MFMSREQFLAVLKAGIEYVAQYLGHRDIKKYFV